MLELLLGIGAVVFVAKQASAKPKVISGVGFAPWLVARSDPATVLVSPQWSQGVGDAPGNEGGDPNALATHLLNEAGRKIGEGAKTYCNANAPGTGALCEKAAEKALEYGKKAGNKAADTVADAYDWITSPSDWF